MDGLGFGEYERKIDAAENIKKKVAANLLFTAKSDDYLNQIPIALSSSRVGVLQLCIFHNAKNIEIKRTGCMK